MPTSISSFAHRRPRSDSVASFAYFDDEQPSPQPDANRSVSDNEEMGEEETYGFETADDLDVESRPAPTGRRKSSSVSRRSVDLPLLARQTSASSSVNSGQGKGGRTSQKIYILTEDLTIVVAGFNTSLLGWPVYVAICLATLGLGYLLLRWLPRWRVKLVGSPRPLRECKWVAIENQWGEMSIHDVVKQRYGRPLSSVFGYQEKGGYREYDEDQDPILRSLRTVDYRYIRFCFHPVKDKFLLGNTWKDPNWKNVQSIRTGLDSEEKEYRGRVFGQNLIDIEEKSTMQLLVDEAFHPLKMIARALDWHVREQVEFNRNVMACVQAALEALEETRRTMALWDWNAVQELKDMRSHWVDWRQEWDHRLVLNETKLLRSVAEFNASFQYRTGHMENSLRDRMSEQHAEYQAALERSSVDIQKRLWADMERVRAEYDRLIHTELRLIRQRTPVAPRPLRLLRHRRQRPPSSRGIRLRLRSLRRALPRLGRVRARRSAILSAVFRRTPGRVGHWLRAWRVSRVDA